MGSRILTLFGSKRRYRTSSFANWTPVVGAAADGVASALGDWLENLVVNGEFTEDTAGWVTTETTISRVDSAVDPGVPSGGADGWAAKVAKTTTTASRYAYCTVSTVLGAKCRLAALGYAPSTNDTDNAAFVYWVAPEWTTAGNIRLYVEDSWEQIGAALGPFSDASGGRLLFAVFGESSGDIVYYDGVEVYRQNTPLLSPHRAASGVWTWAITQPAAPSVVPWSAIVRYLDASNYWEVRTAPNTDGNDLELVEVVAGVETTRAAADVDWTAGETDELRITARGTTIGVEHRKHGETVWTAGLSYASATAHQTASQYGQMQWGTGEKRAASVRWNQ